MIDERGEERGGTRMYRTLYCCKEKCTESISYNVRSDGGGTEKDSFLLEISENEWNEIEREEGGQ